MRRFGSLLPALTRAPRASLALPRARILPPRPKRHISSSGHGGAQASTSTKPEEALDLDTATDVDPSEHDLRFGFYDVILPEEPFVWGTAHIVPHPVPPWIKRPPYVGSGETLSTARQLITEKDDVARLRRAAELAAAALRHAGEMIATSGVGRTTYDIDLAVHDFLTACGAYPSPLGYKDFPRACCTSVNNVIVHGIPDQRPLQDGDIVNVDVTAYLDGFHGDTSRTFLVGDVDEKGRELVSVTDMALEAGIAACGPGRKFSEIGRAIHELLRGRDFSVCPMFTGHGIGREFHRRPWIYHTPNDEPEVMEPGDCFTIEPAIVQGDNPAGVTYPDGWTVSTENCARAAQAEDMVLITDRGVEVLTR